MDDLKIVLESLGPLQTAEKKIQSALPAGFTPERVFCLGKAARALAAAASRLVPGVEGLIYEPAEARPLPLPPGWLSLAGRHPLPGIENVAASRRVEEWFKRGKGPVLALVSGGGSSLLADPAPPWSLEEMTSLERRLLESGAGIDQINAVRVRLSLPRGGGLRMCLRGGPVFTGVWSDVARNSWKLTSSAPTLAVPGLPEAGAVLRELGLGLPRELPAKEVLLQGRKGDRSARLSDSKSLQQEVGTHLRSRGYKVAFHAVEEGTAPDAAAASLRRILEELPASERWAIVGGGETTVRLRPGKAAGRGGRCSHLAASVALELRGLPAWCFAALATDGMDGGGGGGAFVSAGKAPPEKPLKVAAASFDTASLFEDWGGALPRRPTGDNRRDLWVLLKHGASRYME